MKEEKTSGSEKEGNIPTNNRHSVNDVGNVNSSEKPEVLRIFENRKHTILECSKCGHHWYLWEEPFYEILKSSIQKEFEELINKINTVDEINAGLEFQVDNLQNKLNEKNEENDYIKVLQQKNKELIRIHNEQLDERGRMAKILFEKGVENW